MNDRELDKLIEDSLEHLGDNYIDDSDIDFTPHDFTKDLDLGHDTHHIKLTAKHIIPLFIAAMMAAMLAAVGASAVIERASHLAISGDDTFAYVLTGGDDERRETPLRNYQLIDPPFGLVLVREEYDDPYDPAQHSFDYENDTMTVSIDEAQGMHNGTRSGFIVDRTTSQELININKMELYYYVSSNGMHTLLWEENGNFLCLDVTPKGNAKITKDDMMEIFRSVQNAEHKK